MVPLTISCDSILGVLYLLFGVVKVAVGIFLVVAPPKIIADSTIMQFLVKEHDDATLAGHMYEYMLGIFGVFIFLLGLALLKVLPDDVSDFISKRRTEYTVLASIGITLIVFYALVLFTSLPIPKKKSNYAMYKIFGLSAGVCFILSPFILEILKTMLSTFSKLSLEEQSIYGFGILIVLFIAGDIIYNFIKMNRIQVVAPGYVRFLGSVEEAAQDGIVVTKKTVASFSNNENANII